MHIADRYLDFVSAGVTWAAMLAYGYYAYRHSELQRHMELVPSLAAAIFVAQIFNRPMPGGISLHLVGVAITEALRHVFSPSLVSADIGVPRRRDHHVGRQRDKHGRRSVSSGISRV
jgi:cobalt/nickel transport system permease protein